MNYRFVAVWAAASLAGGLAFGAAAFVNFFWAAVAFGFLLSAPQWLVLHAYHVARAWRWVVATSAGMVLAWVVALITGYVTVVLLGVLANVFGEPKLASLWSVGTTIATVVPASLLGGGLVGFIQASAGPATDTHVWSWTRQSALAAAGFWLMALALLYAFRMFPPTDPRVSVASGALGGLAYGLLTGPTLPSAAPAWRTTHVPA